MTRAAPASPPSIAALYLSGLLQGLTLVSFPASSAVLKQMHGFTDAQYGAIFLPQVAAAVIGAVGGGAAVARIGLVSLLRIALVVNALSQFLLAGSALLGARAALIAVLLGTASLGLGFGVSGAPLNGLPPLFFPRHRETAIVAMHTLLGLGLALGPVIANAFISAGHWLGFPALLGALALAACLTTSVIRVPQAERGTAQAAVAGKAPVAANAHPAQQLSFWLYACVATLYAFAEGTFSNWAVLYLQDGKQLPESIATTALSAFWAAIVTGRLLSSMLVLRIPAPRIWLTLPVLMIAAFLLLPYASTPALGIGLFAFAGLACSSFFPLSVGIASERFQGHGPWVSSMLIAALMLGVGVGSYTIGLLREALDMETLYRWSALYPLCVLLLAALALRNPPETSH